MNRPTSVLVLGHGEMGQAMERLLSDGAGLAIWDRFPTSGFRSVALKEAAPAADFVIFCLPTFPYAEVLGELLPYLHQGCICLGVAKGLDEAGRPAAQIFEAALGAGFGYGMLCGPTIAEEIQAGRHSFALLGFRGAAVVERVTTLFSGTRLHVTPVPDLVGINWAVILKNVYALAFGMADELGLGDNVRGWLAVIAARELDAIVQRMGGGPGTAYGLAGLGDLITTATSRNSHHHELGRQLARRGTGVGQAGPIEGEAIRTLTSIDRHRLLDECDFPLYRWIHGVVRNQVDIGRRFEDLLNTIGEAP